MALSKIKAPSIADDSITVDQIADNAVYGRRNLIINGAMQVAQRGTSAINAAANYIVDRFKALEATDGAYTIEQSTDAPDGFTTSLKCQVTTADTSIGAGQYAYIEQAVEAQNLQHLKYGSSSAETLTLSFWVKSSKTGTYSISVYKQDTTGYNFCHEFTIDTADTWEKKIITISPTAGSTSFITGSGGSIANDNGAGFYVSWNLVFGSNYNGATSNKWSSTVADYTTTNAVNWMDSTSNDFYLTGVQLEIGDKATPFEHKSYGEELALCQRYCYVAYEDNNTTGHYAANLGTTAQAVLHHAHPVEMRASPTGTVNGSTIGTQDFTRHTKQHLCWGWSSTDGSGYAYFHNTTSPHKIYTLDADF